MALYLVGSIISVKLLECLSFCDKRKKEGKKGRRNIVYVRETSRLSSQNLNIILKLPFFTIAPKVYQKQEPALHFYL